MKKLVNVKELSREEWLEVRKKSIGGSDAGAVMGMNDWKSCLELYAEKKGMGEDKETTESMRLGTDLEDYVAQRFEEATGKKVRRDNFMYLDDEHDFITANFDRIVIGEDAGLECKTMSPFSKYDVENGEIPAQYYAQCQHYMMVSGFDAWYIAFLVYGKGFYWHQITRDNDFIQKMRYAEEDFWNEHVLKDNPPEADGSESSLNTLSRMYPVGYAREIDLVGVDEAIKKYKEICDLESSLKKDKDALKAKVIEQLMDNESGRSEKYIVTWKNQSRTTVDTDLLKNNYPEVYEKCKKVSESRVFRTKELKVKEK